MRRYLSHESRLVLAAAWMLGCGSDGGNAPMSTDTEDEVEIFSWWLAPGEAGALQGIINIYEADNPGSEVLNGVNANGDDSRLRLAERLESGMPPDLYQENARALRTIAAQHAGKLTPLDDFFAEHELASVLVPETLGDVTVDGRLLALPMGIHRANSLFYNMALFKQHDLVPPDSVDELLEVCEKLKTAGVTPIALSDQGWVHNLLFEMLHQSLLGTARYQEFLEGQPSGEDSGLAEAVELYANIIDNYTNANSSDEGFDWAAAAELVFEGEAAMFAHGDWAKGLFVQRGWVSDVDFGVVGTPGARDLFVYDLDVWVMPKGGPNPEGARRFLEAAVSIEGQLAFDLIKGATSVRKDLPVERLDSIGKAVKKGLEEATVRTTSPLPNMDAIYEKFVADHDADAMLAAMLAQYAAFQKTR
jgi:glucose/mannose transport system substrate-binding protein